MAVETQKRRPQCTEEAHGADPDLGRVLQRARKRREFTLREVEARTGIPNAHISQIEHGQIRRPDPRLVWKLAQFYGLNFGLLATWLAPAEEGADERAAYIDATLRFMGDLDEASLKQVATYVEVLSRSGGAASGGGGPRPRLGIGHSGGGAPAAKIAVFPVARSPK